MRAPPRSRVWLRDLNDGESAKYEEETKSAKYEEMESAKYEETESGKYEEADGEHQVRGDGKRRLGTPSRSPKRAR